MVVVRGRLSPEVGAVVRRSLEAACDQTRRGDHPARSAAVKPADTASDAATSSGWLSGAPSTDAETAAADDA